MLQVDNLDVFYDQLQAVKNVSFEVKKGELVTIIGANGAGKTTILRTLMGLQKCARGSIKFMDQEITLTLPFVRARIGISIVPEGRRIFPDLTVEQNLMMGAYTRVDRNGIANDLKKIFQLFPVLKERRKQVGKTLSGGEQQMLTIGRALMAKPKLLLMDEVSMGLMPIIVEETFKVIKDLHQQGLTILLVEQNARKALSIADRGYVIETGKIVLSGTAEALLSNPAVKKAYLGG
ncbi:MAG: ABC transporter ATP-binding protein [Candidatus Aerophobetes bacterium]|nr:ABC transporter ATP-binding protein [Candidatus Aerophobetes bacterium]